MNLSSLGTFVVGLAIFAGVSLCAAETNSVALFVRGQVDKQTRKSRLSNSLVIVVAMEQGAAIESPKDLATDKVKRLALAEPKTVKFRSRTARPSVILWPW